MATFAEVLADLQATDADLETNVGKVEARITDLQNQLAGGGGTPDEAAALQAEIDRLKALNQRLIAATGGGTPAPTTTAAP